MGEDSVKLQPDHWAERLEARIDEVVRRQHRVNVWLTVTVGFLALGDVLRVLARWLS